MRRVRQWEARFERRMMLCSCSDSPDYSEMAASNLAASQAAERMAEKDLAFRQQQYDDLMPYIREQLETGSAMSKIQAEVARDNFDWATEERERKANLFVPIEERMAEEAMSYGSEADQAKEASKIAGQIDAQSAAALRQRAKTNAAMGINPASGRANETATDALVANSAAKAGAMNSAATQARDKGIALRAGAANYSQGIGNTASNAYSTSVGAGGAAAQTAGAGVNSQLNTAGYVSGGYSNLINNQYKLMDANNQVAGIASRSGGGGGEAASAVGTIAMAAMMMSSKEVKTKKKPIADVLERLRSVPVEQWQYKKGVEDEGTHIGPYAEDMNEQFGDEVAPQGRMIDIISQQGVIVKAVQELADRVDSIAAKQGVGRG